MARFITLSVATILFSLAASLWSTVDLFGINKIVFDQTNTIVGTLISFAGCSSSNGVITSCANNLLTGVSIVSLVLVAAGGTTILAFGNTFLAQGLLLAFVPCIATMYDTVTTVLDVFNVPSDINLGIGLMVVTVFIITFVMALISIQGKVYLGS